MKRLALLALVLSTSLLGVGRARAQMPKPETVVLVRAEPGRASLKPGGTAALAVVATIKEGFHINSHKPIQDYLIPTRVELLEASAFVVVKVDYPPGELKTFGFAPDEKLSVYEGIVRVPVRLRAKPNAPAGTHELRLAFHYQACNDRFCLRPASRDATLKVEVR